ncbi:MAG TPA: metal ABC transporter permease, partial [Treponemataceae bacterium]|nr:metal ABC transporter permease [Treponemataceae bacterium]
YLFGNILLLSNRDLLLLAVLDILVVFLAWRFYPQINASSFDEEFARVRGVRTDAVFLALLAVTAVSVVLLQTFVGIVMVIAMLTLPSGTAGYVSKSVAGMMVFGTVFSLLFTGTGIALSWTLDVPAGALVVVLAGAVFLFSAAARMLSTRIRKRKSASAAGGGRA